MRTNACVALGCVYLSPAASLGIRRRSRLVSSAGCVRIEPLPALLPAKAIVWLLAAIVWMQLLPLPTLAPVSIMVAAGLSPLPQGAGGERAEFTFDEARGVELKGVSGPYGVFEVE